MKTKESPAVNSDSMVATWIGWLWEISMRRRCKHALETEEATNAKALRYSQETTRNPCALSLERDGYREIHRT